MPDPNPHFALPTRRVNLFDSYMNVVDSGAGENVLFLHGNPTWSYLWRNVIPYVSEIARVLAPDLIGMGRSGKPDLDYRFFDQARYLDQLLEKLEVDSLTVVGHDWGGVLGLHWAHRHPDRIRGLALMETNILPYPDWDHFPAAARSVFETMRSPDMGWDFVVRENRLIEEVMPGGVMRALSAQEMNHYREPFLAEEHRTPMWRWVNDIPISGEPRDVHEVVVSYGRWLATTSVPKLLFTVTPGAIVQDWMVDWCLRNLTELELVQLGPGRHFIQEDYPEEIGTGIRQWLSRCVLPSAG